MVYIHWLWTTNLFLVALFNGCNIFLKFRQFNSFLKKSNIRFLIRQIVLSKKRPGEKIGFTDHPLDDIELTIQMKIISDMLLNIFRATILQELLWFTQFLLLLIKSVYFFFCKYIYINHALLNFVISNCFVTFQLYLVVCCLNKTTMML